VHSAATPSGSFRRQEMPIDQSLVGGDGALYHSAVKAKKPRQQGAAQCFSRHFLSLHARRDPSIIYPQMFEGIQSKTNLPHENGGHCILTT
jgi:hypothetical protein